MKIIVGTQNRIKIEAVRETIENYDFLKGAAVEGIEAGSGVDKQPKSIDETVAGAKNRAAAAATGADFGVGIEDGLIKVPGTLTGYMNVCVAAFYGGKRFYLGMSAGFEYPPRAVELVEKGLDINEAFYKMKLTDNPRIGSSRGAVGILTRNRWQRKDTVKQALVAALIQLDNPDLYGNPEV